jgi:signal transduction histidine kinase
MALLAEAGRFVYLLPVRSYKNPIGMGASLQMSDLGHSAFVLLIATLGALIVLRTTNRRIGWLMLAAGFSLAIVDFTSEYSQYALLVAPQANLPLDLLAGWVQDLWTIPLMLLFSLPFLFPDGKLPSRRWQTIFRLHTAAWSLFILVFAFGQRPLANVFLELEAGPPNPFGIIPASDMLYQVAFGMLVAVSIVTGIASVISRWRGTSGDVRQQIKWMLYSLFLMLVTLAASLVDTLLREGAGVNLGLDKVLPVAMNLSLFGLLAALGIAVLKYRLYDIDLLISRTLVYGGLTLAIVLGYVLLVSGLGALLPDGMGLLPSLIATGILAVLFAPIKDRLQRGANRLVYGERQQPYEVMRTLGAHLETATVSERVLPAIVETIARSLKFPYVSITLQRANDFAAKYGRRHRHVIDLPLYHQAKLVGYLSVCLRDGEKEMAEQDQELLSHIALWLGPVAQASTLTQELRHSHARLVSARAEERRRLYRDLHDGLGPTLASQTLRFDHALELLPDDPQAATKILCDLKEQTQGLVLEIRRLVYALRSSTLDELGLIGSLREAIEGFRGSINGVRISLEGDEQALRQLPAAHEQAAERIALEALTNVARHAHANCCRLVLEIQEGPPPLLHLTIEDDGRGLRPGYSPGVGIASMIKRAEALGGSLNFETNRPQGTRVVVKLPFPHDHYLLELR